MRLDGLVAGGFLSSAGGILFGYDQALMSILLTMESFVKWFPEAASVIVSDDGKFVYHTGSGALTGFLFAVVPLGALVGALNHGWIADSWSRKWAIVGAATLVAAGAGVQAAAHKYATLVGGRFLGGLGIGMLSSVAPLYVSEILEPQNSRRLTVFEACGTVFGLVTGFLVGLWALASCLRKDWSWGFIFLPTPLFIAFWLILVALVWPHSPHWLALKGRENEEGRRTVARLRSRQVDEQEVVGEWIDTKVEVRYQRRLLGLDHMDLGPNHIRKTFKLQFAGWRRLVWVVCQKRTAKAAALTVCQQFVGMSALSYNAPVLILMVGIRPDEASYVLLTGVLNMGRIIGVAVGGYLLCYCARTRRRCMLLGGSIVMLVSHLVIAGVLSFYSPGWSSPPSPRSSEVAASVNVPFLVLFTMFAGGLCWEVVPQTVMSEMHPSSLRAPFEGILRCVGWLFNCIITLVVPILVALEKRFAAFVFFAATCFLAGIGAFLWALETAHKTQEQIDLAFDDEYRDQAGEAAIRQQMRDDETHNEGIELA